MLRGTIPCMLRTGIDCSRTLSPQRERPNRNPSLRQSRYGAAMRTSAWFGGSPSLDGPYRIIHVQPFQVREVGPMNQSIRADLVETKGDNSIPALERRMQGGRRRLRFFASQSASSFRQSFSLLRLTVAGIRSLLKTRAMLFSSRCRIGLVSRLQVIRNALGIPPVMHDVSPEVSPNARDHWRRPERDLSDYPEPQ